MATCFGLDQFVMGPVRGKIADVMLLHVKRMVLAFLSCGIPHYKIIFTMKL